MNDFKKKGERWEGERPKIHDSILRIGFGQSLQHW